MWSKIVYMQKRGILYLFRYLRNRKDDEIMIFAANSYV